MLMIKEKIQVLAIGHSNRSIDTFLELLNEYQIQVLIDIRRFPTSKIEHFKKEQMQKWLSEHGIEYIWLGNELGGYRQGGYKKHMRTKLFKEGVKKLCGLAASKRVCLMCMEKNPKYCHRRFISTNLERKGAKLIHIIEKGQKSLTV